MCFELWLWTSWVFKVTHANILPWIFYWGNKENVFTFDIVAAVVCIRCSSIWWWDFFVKSLLTKICVESFVLHLWVNRIPINIIGSLEKSKFIANEPIPSSAGFFNINSCVLKEFHCILSQIWTNMLIIPFLYQVHIIIKPLQIRYHITELSSQTILHWARKNVSDETHDVFISDC